MVAQGKASFISAGLAACAVSVALFKPVDASTLVPNINLRSFKVTDKTPTHAIILKCETTGNWGYQSKGAILKINGAANTKNDFAIVSGHGLNSNPNCFVSDFQGNSEPVLSKRFAKNYKAGTATDWAVISFKRIKGEHIIRYDVDIHLKNPASLDKADVAFAEARGLPENNQSCKIAVLELNTSEKSPLVFSHNCRAIPGQSGSPITYLENNNHRLAGFHLGYLWTVNSPLTGKPGRINFFRPFDSDMANEVKSAIKDLEE